LDTEWSVTEWIALARNADEEAVQKLYERYVEQLIALASKRLKVRGHPCRAEDGEDVVQCLFESFFRQLQAGQFPKLSDRDSLWPMLVTIAKRKAANQVRHARAKKRGGGLVRGESAFEQAGQGDGEDGLDMRAVAKDASPEEVVALAEEYERFLATLDDAERQIVRLKNDGFEETEIAEELGCSLRTVERKWAAIKAKLREAAT
jgi:RNA polymerase sigma factor (sigma-70 family)